MSIAKDSTARRRMDLAERLVREGLPYSTQASFNGTAAVNAAWGSALSFPGITRAVYVESIIITSNRNLVVQVSMNAAALGSGYTDFADVVVGPGSPVTIPVRQIIRPSHYMSGQNSTVAFGGGAIRALLGDADYTNTRVQINALGYHLTDDLNFNADKALLFVGDSIYGGGTGPSTKMKQTDWRMLNYLKGAGLDYRIINQAISGTTSTHAERRRAHGDYDHAQVDRIVYAMGANDASQGAANFDTTYRANLAAFLAWKEAHYPDAILTVLGPTPQENNAGEANAAVLRQRAAAAVAEANDPKVSFCDLGAAFDRTAAGNYANSDAAGNRIHPSDAGHDGMWLLLKAHLDARPLV